MSGEELMIAFLVESARVIGAALILFAILVYVTRRHNRRKTRTLRRRPSKRDAEQEERIDKAVREAVQTQEEVDRMKRRFTQKGAAV